MGPPKTVPSQEAEEGQLVITLNGTTREITKIEKLDDKGHRRELTPDECMTLAGEDDADEIEAVVHEVYRVAVADTLGEEEEQEDELAMRRLLVSRLFVRRMLQRGVRRMLKRRLLRMQALRNRRQPRETPMP
jgi:hypothetical protein